MADARVSFTTMPFFPSLNQDAVLPAAFVRNQEERPKVADHQFSIDIPIISLADIHATGHLSRERCSSDFESIIKACEEWGVFQVVDHGIDASLIAAMAELSRAFFFLPADDKLRYNMSAGDRGGFKISSHLQGEAVENWREFFTFFSYPAEEKDYQRWPEEPKGWRKVVEDYCDACMRVASRILEVLSLAMGLEKGELKESCMRMEQKLLVNFYPKCPQPELTLGLRQHTDPGTITLLLQDQVEGLQVTRDEGQTWFTVKPVEGALVVNLGDHAHYLSNGRFVSVKHRVVVNSSSDRMSIVALQYPSQEAIVYPLKLNQREKPILEQPMTFKEMYKKKMIHDVEVAEDNGKSDGKVG